MVSEDHKRRHDDRAAILHKQFSKKYRNRSNILVVVITREKKTAHFIYDTVPLDNNIREARNKKLQKYIDLAHEIKDIYQLKSLTRHPIIIFTNGLIGEKLTAEIEKR